MTATEPKRLMHPFWMSLAVLFGVVLPVITLAIEMATRMCTAAFFDPIPTLWHVALVAAVPVTNAWTLWNAHRRSRLAPRWIWLANGFALGVALYYTILYLPLTPIAVLAIIAFGWGLLPLAPLFSLLVTLRLRSLLQRCCDSSATPRGRWWLAFAAGVAVVAVLQIPDSLTRGLAQMATSDDTAVAARGIYWLRTVGCNDTLLRDCYGTSRGMDFTLSAFVPALQAVPAERARELYYRATGRVFNSVPPPQKNYTARRWDFLDEFEWDDALGGEAVAGVMRGLSLRESRLDMVCSPDEAWEYAEWILEFANSSQQQREARAQISLPPGAVVSRLTLWINGEEHEAAFGGRAQTRRAYQEVAVSQRRDPVLVTSCGSDQILMQCFPVPANGTMKVRLGITAPLVLRSANEAVLTWPCFLERNFKLPSDLRHSVWIQSPREATNLPNILTSLPSGPGSFTIRGQILDAALGNGSAAVTLRRDGTKNRFAVPAPSVHPKGLVLQTIEPAAKESPSRVVAVVDGSATMKPYANHIADALTELSAKTDLRILVAQDEIKLVELEPSAAAARLRRLRYRGGHDNLPALAHACELASKDTNNLVVWIHAPQPVLLSSIERLRQLFERTPPAYRPRILDWSVQPGPNRVIEKLDDLSVFYRLPIIQQNRSHLQQWIKPEQVVSRQLSASASVPDGSALASDHVTRLWAKEETDRLIAQRKITEAQALATAHKLVTPVTGAVVLETIQQYAQHDLHPTDPTVVPTVPEPGTWLLLVLALILLIATHSVLQRVRRLCRQKNITS